MQASKRYIKSWVDSRIKFPDFNEGSKYFAKSKLACAHVDVVTEEVLQCKGCGQVSVFSTYNIVG